MKSLVVINFNNQNPFNFDLSNFEFEVKHFNYETHQVGKYFNKFEEEVLDELKKSDYVLINGKFIIGDVLNNLLPIYSSNTIKQEMESIHQEELNLNQHYKSGILCSLKL